MKYNLFDVLWYMFVGAFIGGMIVPSFYTGCSSSHSGGYYSNHSSRGAGYNNRSRGPSRGGK